MNNTVQHSSSQNKIKYVESHNSDSTHVSISCQSNLLFINPVNLGVGVSGSAGKGLAEREAVKKFSQSSATRMRRYLRTCRAEYQYFITLTYPHSFPLDGAESKEHLRRFMQELKRENEREEKRTGKSRGRFSAFWFLEFQDRGAIHYHIFSTHYIDYRWLRKTWYDIVGSEDRRHLAAGTSVEKLRSGRFGTCAYATKYAAKAVQKEVPDFLKNVGRFWGVTGDRVAVSAATIVKHTGFNTPRVDAAIKKLSRELRRLIDEGKAVKVEFKNDQKFIMYNLKTLDAVFDINRLVAKLEYLNRMESVPPTYELPHHELGGKSDDYSVL